MEQVLIDSLEKEKKRNDERRELFVELCTTLKTDIIRWTKKIKDEEKKNHELDIEIEKLRAKQASKSQIKS